MGYPSLSNTVVILSLMGWIISWRILTSVQVLSDATGWPFSLCQILAKWIFQSDGSQCFCSEFRRQIWDVCDGILAPLGRLLCSVRVLT